MRSRDPGECYADLTLALDGSGVRWALAGALAVRRYTGTDRLTSDADLLVEWDPRLFALIEATGRTIRSQADPGDPPHLLRTYRTGDPVVDFLVALTPYQQEALRRASDHVLTIEDVLVHKLIAGRPKDRDDVRAILATGRPFDLAYVRRWLEEFGFDHRLAEFGL